jgi:hypothetical protein
LRAKNWAYRLSGAAMPPKKQTPAQRDRSLKGLAAGRLARAGAVPPSARRRTF